MLHYYKLGQVSLEQIVQKMSHAVADCFSIKDRGYIREGYFADMVIVDVEAPFTVEKKNVLYKCGWSPLEGFTLPASVTYTIVNGNIVYEKGGFNESDKGSRLTFNRQ